MKRTVDELLFAITKLQGDVISVDKEDLELLAYEVLRLSKVRNLLVSTVTSLEKKLEREDKINKSLMARL